MLALLVKYVLYLKIFYIKLDKECFFFFLLRCK